MAVQILKYYNISSCKLISNNPKKLEALELSGIKVELLSLKSKVNNHNRDYLQTKKKLLNHKIKGL